MLADTASDTCRETVRAMPEPAEKGEKWKGEERKVAEGRGEERRGRGNRRKKNGKKEGMQVKIRRMTR